MATEPNDPHRPAPASAATVAGLAREVDALRRAVRKAAELHTRVDQLGATLAQALDDLAGTGRRADPVRPVSWIAESTDPQLATTALRELAEWVGQVYLRYPIAARELPDCWLWHPDMVEELAWLHQAWRSAYGAETGSIAAAGDWHDRYRPGVVARIRAASRSCSLENHTPDTHRVGRTTAPSAGSVEPIARWWTTARHQPPPLPSAADLDAADRRLKEGRR